MRRAFAALALAACFPVLATAGTPTVVFQTSWPVPSSLFGPFDVVGVPGDMVLVSDLVQVRQYTPSGGLLGSWLVGPVGLNDHGNPALMATDGVGNVYMGVGLGYMGKFTSGGSQLAMWRIHPNNDGTAPEAYGMAVGSDGNIFVSDDNSRNIQKYTPDGQFLLKWGTQGMGPGQFYTVAGLAADRSGHLFALDSGTNFRVQVFDLNGNFLYQFGSYGTGDGQFQDLEDIAIDPAGNLYISDLGLKRVQEFRPDGTFVGIVAGPGTGPGQLKGPGGIGVDAAGNVYVADLLGQVVDKFGPAPVPVAVETWGRVKAIYHGDDSPGPRTAH